MDISLDVSRLVLAPTHIHISAYIFRFISCTALLLFSSFFVFLYLLVSHSMPDFWGGWWRGMGSVAVLCGELRTATPHHVQIAKVDFRRFNRLDRRTSQLCARKLSTTLQCRQLYFVSIEITNILHPLSYIV